MPEPSHSRDASQSANFDDAQHSGISNQPRQWNALLAMFLAFCFPGLGQLYKGQFLRAVLWFICILIGYSAYLVPGVILQICCVLDAGLTEPKRDSHNAGQVK